MDLDTSGISKKKKNHPNISDGSFRQEHQIQTVPTSTNIVTQNVTMNNITSLIKQTSSFRRLKSIIIVFL